MTSPISRLAPTPSGYLHLGNILNFVTTWALVRRRQGKLYLRIDDVDLLRARPEYREDIFQTLTWLGLDWDELLPAQSTRVETYRTWLQRFPHYVCDCSRKQLEERGSQSYDGHCRSRGLSFVAGVTQIRLRADVASMDVVLWRKENLPSYQLASLVDDIEARVNLVVRGEDLRESTKTQLAMAGLLGSAAATFREARFVHHQLLRGASGEKLSKSLGDFSIHQMRQLGLSPADVYGQLAQRLGLPASTSKLADFLTVDWEEGEDPT